MFTFSMRAQARHPAEDVRIAAQLLQRAHPVVSGAKIRQEFAAGSTVVTRSVWIERSAEGIDSAVEDRSQRMLERRPPGAVHDEVTGSGRMCWATARAY